MERHTRLDRNGRRQRRRFSCSFLPTPQSQDAWLVRETQTGNAVLVLVRARRIWSC